MTRRVLLSWSSGKDSAWALHQLRRQSEVEVVGLLTTFNEAFARVAMHGVRRELVLAQAARAGLPLWEVPLRWPCSNELYEARMRELLDQARQSGVTHLAFGDLYLSEIRAYRERLLVGSGIEPLFPLWCRSDETMKLAQEMLNGGVSAVIVCIDPRKLPVSFLGRDYDAGLLADLPEGVDPCGEQGEFHTFCHAGPMYTSPLDVQVGTKVERDGFHFAELQQSS